MAPTKDSLHSADSSATDGKILVSSAITNIIQDPQVSTSSSSQSASKSRNILWLRRFTFVAFVLVSLWAGMVLLIAPWTAMWSNNGFLLSNLVLRGILLHNFVRGAISGLGLVNLWMGVWEGVHYHERPADAHNR